MTEKNADELWDLELRGWAALSEGRGREFYGELLADNAVVVVPGAVLDREQTLTSWDGVPPWQWYELVKRHVVHLDGAVALIYDVTAQRALEPRYRATASSIYCLRPEGRRLLIHQQTPSD